MDGPSVRESSSSGVTMRRSLTILAAARARPWPQGRLRSSALRSGRFPAIPRRTAKASRPTTRCASTGVSATASCGFPTQGLQYLLVTAAGRCRIRRRAAPSRDRSRRPRPRSGSRFPLGATQVSFDWEFFNSEGSPSASFNDGMSIDVVGPAGNLVGALIYADTNTPAGTCTHASGGTERAPAAAPQNLLATLPPHAACDYISIVVWNGGDNAVASRGCVDNVLFDSDRSGCAVPCFGVTPALVFSSPGGLGCLQANLSGLPLGGTLLPRRHPQPAARLALRREHRHPGARRPDQRRVPLLGAPLDGRMRGRGADRPVLRPAVRTDALCGRPRSAGRRTQRPDHGPHAGRDLHDSVAPPFAPLIARRAPPTLRRGRRAFVGPATVDSW